MERSNPDWQWPEFYDEFRYFSDRLVRAGCHPRRMVHRNPTGRSVVLVHGLSDSPFFMSAVGEYFYQVLGFDVYIPLLQCHGLIDPKGMEGVSLVEWKKNVLFSIKAASTNGNRVSIGGLSTGGALSFFMACAEAEVIVDLYLFSPALGLYGRGWQMYSGVQQSLLRLKSVRYFDSPRPLVGANPYRYIRVTWNSARELAKLIRENQQLMVQLKGGGLSAKRTFAAWTEYDRVISLKPIRDLEKMTGPALFFSYIIPESVRVDHASLMLKEPLYALDAKAGDLPLEEANPLFSQMLAAIADFVSAQPV